MKDIHSICRCRKDKNQTNEQNFTVSEVYNFEMTPNSFITNMQGDM